MKALVVFILLALLSGPSFAQQKKQNMSRESRERLREDMRQVNKEGAPGARHERHRPMTPQERDKLRHDIQDANKSLKK